MLHPNGVLSLSILISPNWNASNERLVAPSLAAFHSPLSHFYSPRLLYLPLRVTLTHFTLSSYERALRLPTSFPISGLARLGVKPRLCRSSWRAFASTHPLMLPSTSPMEALLAYPPCPPWNLPSFTVEFTLSSPCSRSDPPLIRQSVTLAHLDSLPLTIWCFGQTALFLFLLAKETLAYLITALCGTKATLSFSAGPVCSSFSVEACAILHALCWSRQHQQVCHFSSPPIRLSFCPLLHLSFYVRLSVRSGRNCYLSSVVSGYNESPDIRFSRGMTRLTSWPDGEQKKTYLEDFPPYIKRVSDNKATNIINERQQIRYKNVMTDQTSRQNFCNLS